MQGYNLLMVYHADMDKVLMCKRLKEPYKGLSNFVGGKIETDETGFEAAYRELQEETSISKDAIHLHHIMDFTYHLSNCYIEVYAGIVHPKTAVSGDENELYWSDVDEDFFDMSVYAGEGNIGHMIEQVHLMKHTFLNALEGEIS